jgi:hypothetical protein
MLMHTLWQTQQHVLKLIEAKSTTHSVTLPNYFLLQQPNVTHNVVQLKCS